MDEHAVPTGIPSRRPRASRAFAPAARAVALAAAIALLPWGGAPASAEEGGDRWFLGIRPAFTVEPEYPAGVFDLNALPATVEWQPAGAAFGLRAGLVLNLRLGGDSVEPSHVGLLVSLPFYPFGAAAGPRSGFFLGPKTGLTYNLRDGSVTTGLHAESGWAFAFDDFSVKVCGELGATLFLPRAAAPRLGGHGGLSAVLGFWLPRP